MNSVIAVSVFSPSKFYAEHQNNQFKPAGQGVSPLLPLPVAAIAAVTQGPCSPQLTGGRCPC